MGTVKIEFATRDKKFIMELETDNLCAINCLAGKVEFLDTIRDICIAEEIILIRTEDRDFRNGCLIAPLRHFLCALSKAKLTVPARS